MTLLGLWSHLIHLVLPVPKIGEFRGDTPERLQLVEHRFAKQRVAHLSAAGSGAPVELIIVLTMMNVVLLAPVGLALFRAYLEWRENETIRASPVVAMGATAPG